MRELHNTHAREGCDRCSCGCKYWEHDRCIDCGKELHEILFRVELRLAYTGPSMDEEAAHSYLASKLNGEELPPDVQLEVMDTAVIAC